METSIKPQMQSLAINYNAPCAVNIGDVFYVIRLARNSKNDADNGTNYVATFDAENDTKSN